MLNSTALQDLQQSSVTVSSDSLLGNKIRTKYLFTYSLKVGLHYVLGGHSSLGFRPSWPKRDGHETAWGDGIGKPDRP